MSANTSILNVGEFAKPINTLIERISDAIGVLYEPKRIEKLAKAKAKSKLIEAEGDLQARALARWKYEEIKKQENIESILEKSFPLINGNSSPEKIEEDWFTHFFNNCRNISNEEMQHLWSSILAGEVNKPGSYSKRTISFMNSLDKYDAEIFKKLCAFNWYIDSNVQPIVYLKQSDLYEKNGVTFERLKHLDAIGLIDFQSISSFQLLNVPEHVVARYDNTFSFKFNTDPNIKDGLEVGNVILTSVGVELASVFNPDTIENFSEFVINKWKSFNLEIDENIIALHS